MAGPDIQMNIDYRGYRDLDVNADLGQDILLALNLQDIRSLGSRNHAYAEREAALGMEPEKLIRSLKIPSGWHWYAGERAITCWSDRAMARFSAHGSSSRSEVKIMVWAETYELADAVTDRLLGQFAQFRITECAFDLHWRYISGGNDIGRSKTTEKADDVLMDEAYPVLGGAEAFIKEYLGAPEPVLVLHGPPGTGKTRLIRAILAEMSRRKHETEGENADVLYTGDPNVLERDEVFIEFIDGSHDAFVVEDADAFLLPRSKGNQMLHRFLNIADGIVRAQHRKIIFSTNLPSTHDIDAAMLRPGRCFEHVYFPELTPEQALQLAARLCAGGDALQHTLQFLKEGEKSSYSVADVYAAHRRATAPVPERRSRRGAIAPRRAVGFVG